MGYVVGATWTAGLPHIAANLFGLSPYDNHPQGFTKNGPVKRNYPQWKTLR